MVNPPGPIALDTNVVVDLMRGHDGVRRNFDLALVANTPFRISALVLQELLFGAERSGAGDRERRKLAPILRAVEVFPFEAADAEVGGRARAAMEDAGRRAPLGDFIVGVHALARNCPLVTANTRHFQNIPGLKLLNWRLSPEEQDIPHA